MKVLVVDDVGYSRHYHQRLIERFGHQAETADSGQQALKILERDFTINVVLTDLMMRQMDGVELFKRSLRINRLVDGGNADPPAFLLMTVLRPGKDSAKNQDTEKVRMAIDIGFADVLFKPIEPDALKRALDALQNGRPNTHVDIPGTVREFSRIVDTLIAEQQSDDAGRLLDAMQPEVDRLEGFASSSCVANASTETTVP